MQAEKRAGISEIKIAVLRASAECMTYYEELGLQSDAAADEIRHAYRTLARLLHPDRQPDPELRALAERQMKRLRDVVAILSHPRKRRRCRALRNRRNWSGWRWVERRAKWN